MQNQNNNIIKPEPKKWKMVINKTLQRILGILGIVIVVLIILLGALLASHTWNPSWNPFGEKVDKGIRDKIFNK